jgi:hypothetical protein
VPASQEIGSRYVHVFNFDDPPERVASLMMDWAQTDSIHLFRRKMRQKYTWQAIFENEIRPLLAKD